ncbi:hypothetical protein S40293_02227 [Stachybotrys chartarum IBT 40293]|nr:hypothetical protein S40293_02227 [Stachybotrys chartarum IBT 40293]
MRSQLFLSVGAAVSLAAAAPSIVSRTPCPPQVPDLAELLQDPELSFDSRTLITFPGQSNFTEATERWAQFAVPTYSAAVSPATEQDVVTLVQLAAEHEIPFLATGGRHGYSRTLTRLRNGLAIDLSSLDEVIVDAEAQTMTTGAGVIFGDIFEPLYNAGFLIQTGVCSCPGMIGVTIGSGVGRLEGLYGLVADALESVRIVIANGTLLTASRRENADLFWAIRGAGANFGVITSATYNVHPLPRGGNMTYIDMQMPGYMNASYFEALGEFVNGDNEMPAELSVSSKMGFDVNTGGAALMANWVYAGPEAEAREILAPILALNAPVVVVRETSWNYLIRDSNFGLERTVCAPQPVTVMGANIRTVDTNLMVNVFEQLAGFFHDTPEARASGVVFESFPTQATRAVPDDDSAYPWRDVKTLAMLQPNMPLNSTSWPAAMEFFQGLRAEIGENSGYDGLRVYVNYAQGDETPAQIYSETKLPRLVELKNQYDPTNVFRYNHPIPLAYP